VGFAETHDDALVTLDFLVARELVVGADEDFSASDDGPAVSLAAEAHRPLDVLLLVGSRAPVGRQVLIDEVDEVALNRSAEERPGAGGCVFLVLLLLLLG